MFTSNNTTQEEYPAALEAGAILNLDDLSFVDKVPDTFPELICFRYNPGNRRSGNVIIGTPAESKYGLRHDQLIDGFSRAIDRGARRFGQHAMIISNHLDYTHMVETVRMLLELIEEIGSALDIQFEFINIGGGIGIPYRPENEPFDLESLARQTSEELAKFRGRGNGYQPKLFMESGRAVTGPHGVLVTQAINTMSKHKEYVGVNACMSSLMRPGMYGRDCYHHITVADLKGALVGGTTRAVDVVGSLCENNDKFAVDRALPEIVEGDFVIIHDTGAHGHAMGFQYNARLRPQELLLLPDGGVELIRRAETIDDYLRTAFEFEPKVLAG